MQFTRFTVNKSAVVINAVGCVAVLLNLCKKNTATDSVKSTCVNEEYIALFNIYFIDIIKESVIFN